MSYFDFRESIESAVPWWVPFAVPVLIFALAAVLALGDRRGRY